MKNKSQVEKRIEELEKEIEFLKSDAKGDEDYRFITLKKAELKGLKFVIED